MSFMIFAYIKVREIKKNLDRFAIAINCYVYLVRVSTEDLKKTECSLSLVMLALYLFNDEIIINDNKNYKPLDLNLYDFLKQEFLKNFMFRFCNEFIFVKDCRFVNVELLHSDVETVSHV